MEHVPNYYRDVPNPMLKSNFKLYAWERRAATWDIDCDWDNSMTRAEAFEQYSTEFQNPKTIYTSTNCMLALSIMSMCFAVLIGSSIFCMACGGDYFPMFLLGALYRIGLYTCVWILYTSLGESAEMADNNLVILKG